MFMDQPFHPTLKNHGLTGKLRGLRAISAGYDLRVVYEEEGGHATVLLLNTGSHVMRCIKSDFRNRYQAIKFAHPQSYGDRHKNLTSKSSINTSLHLTTSEV